MSTLCLEQRVIFARWWCRFWRTGIYGRPINFAWGGPKNVLSPRIMLFRKHVIQWFCCVTCI